MLVNLLSLNSWAELSSESLSQRIALERIKARSPKQIAEERDMLISIFRITYKNLDNPEFDVKAFTLEIGMSRTPLHNKIKALTGLSTTEFVRVIRLEKARKLLTDNNCSVSHIAYQVGFRDQRHFATWFKKTYKVTPTTYRKTQLPSANCSTNF